MTTSPSPVVLILGHDDILLETRHWILERAGIKAYISTQLHEMKMIAATHPIDVLVLCHTLSATEREEAIASVHALRPAAQNLVLEPVYTRANGEKKPVERVYAGPRTLLTRVLRMVDHPTSVAA